MKNKEKLGKWLFVLYLIAIIWIILFKFQLHPDDIKLLSDENFGTVNLEPFQAPKRINGRIDYTEIIYNVLIFIPYGLLFPVVSKHLSTFKKIIIMLATTMALEGSQYLFSLGACDITDVITNLSGGIIGLALYAILRLVLSEEKADRFLIKSGYLFYLCFWMIYTFFIKSIHI